MRLQVTRSQSAKSKLLGGSETIYWLHLKAETSEDEAELLKKYGCNDYPFELPEEFFQLRHEKKLEGPHGLTLESLRQGVAFGCKFLAASFTALPRAIMEEYEGLLGRIRARETWGGEETLSAEY